VVLLNAHTGEVLAMASSPTFDANQLSSTWESLVNDPNSPLFDRAAMGLYPAGSALGPFLLANSQIDPDSQYPGTDLANCAMVPSGLTWGEVIAAGCQEAVRQLVSSMDSNALISFLDESGLFTAPPFPVETLSSSRPDTLSDNFTYITGEQADPSSGATLKVSPLQMALLAASLSNAGERPSPHLVMAVDTPLSGWVSIPASSTPQSSLQASAANNTARKLSATDLPIWEVVSTLHQDETTSSNGQNAVSYSWYLGGTSPDWKGAPLAIAVLLEEKDPQLAQEIGRAVFNRAIYP
jgi:cell division protein FtsI/penicillin-binding protein 2